MFSISSYILLIYPHSYFWYIIIHTFSICHPYFSMHLPHPSATTQLLALSMREMCNLLHSDVGCTSVSPSLCVWSVPTHSDHGSLISPLEGAPLQTH